MAAFGLRRVRSPKGPQLSDHDCKDLHFAKPCAFIVKNRFYNSPRSPSKSRTRRENPAAGNLIMLRAF